MMRLLIGDMHLLNEASDKYSKIFPLVKDSLIKFKLIDYINSVDILGDILDCEYVTYKRISYFTYIMDLISELFSDNKRILIGNHDKYFKNDQHNENIIQHIKFDGEVINSPIIYDRILYIPHYYNKDNFPIGLLNEDDFDLIIGHLGLQFVNGIEELTIEDIHSQFNRTPIISGHIHNMSLDYSNQLFFLGSLKSESWKEQSPVYSICINDNKERYFIIYPYSKIHLQFEVNNENSFRDDLLNMFNKVHYHNMYCCLYYGNGDMNTKLDNDKYITTMMNLKLRITDKIIKKRDIDLIIEYCRHQIDDPAFMNISIKTIYQMENKEIPLGDGVKNKIDIDKKVISDQKMLMYDFIDEIKSGKKLELLLKSNKKFSKLIETIDDGEIERFSEFLITYDKTKEFNDLIKMIL